MDPFKRKIVEEWELLGYTAFCETIWTSSLKHTELGKIRSFLRSNRFLNVDASIVVPQDEDTSRIQWIKYYDQTGQCISINKEISIPAYSNNLKLTFCYKSEEARRQQKQQVDKIVNALRFIFGVPVAKELIYSREFSNDQKAPVTLSPEGFASYFDTQGLNMLLDPPIEQSKLINLPEEAAILLSKSLAQTFPSERFVLMWLAFESIINSLSSASNNGNKRKEFFKDTLKSEVINDEVYRLFKVRCDLFKEGRYTVASIEKDCWALYQIIQISILDNCCQRDAFVKGLESTLLVD